MFHTVKRIIDWCGEFKGKLYAGFVVLFFSHLFTALPIMAAAYTVGLLLQSALDGTPFNTSWVWKSLVLLLALVFLRFLFDYLRARFQEAIGYELVARDRLAVGDALKRVSLVFLLLISRYSAQNAPVEAQANRDMTGAILEYVRGLAVVKSFGRDAAALDTINQSIADSKNIHLKIEWGYLPSNALHLLALKCGSVGLALSACLSGLNGQMELPVVLVFVFFSFSIFASLEPISDSAHVLSVIDDAMDQLDKLRENHFIDSDGKDLRELTCDSLLSNISMVFQNVYLFHDTIRANICFGKPDATEKAPTPSSSPSPAATSSSFASAKRRKGGNCKVTLLAKARIGVFLLNDIYGFISWQKMKERQSL